MLWFRIEYLVSVFLYTLCNDVTITLATTVAAMLEVGCKKRREFSVQSLW